MSEERREGREMWGIDPSQAEGVFLLTGQPCPPPGSKGLEPLHQFQWVTRNLGSRQTKDRDEEPGGMAVPKPGPSQSKPPAAACPAGRRGEEAWVRASEYKGRDKVTITRTKVPRMGEKESVRSKGTQASPKWQGFGWQHKNPLCQGCRGTRSWGWEHVIQSVFPVKRVWHIWRLTEALPQVSSLELPRVSDQDKRPFFHGFHRIRFQLDMFKLANQAEKCFETVTAFIEKESLGFRKHQILSRFDTSNCGNDRWQLLWPLVLDLSHLSRVTVTITPPFKDPCCSHPTRHFLELVSFNLPSNPWEVFALTHPHFTVKETVQKVICQKSCGKQVAEQGLKPKSAWV